jgi:hypothetical protein
MADMRHMDADLMGASGFKAAGNKSDQWLAIPPQKLIFNGEMGKRLTALARLDDRHTVAVRGGAINRRINNAMGAGWHTPNQRRIGALQRARPAMIGKLIGKVLVGRIVFSHN